MSTERLHFIWTDYCCSFDCPCGKSDELILSEPDEPKTCDGCGRTFMLRAFVVVTPPDEARALRERMGA